MASGLLFADVDVLTEGIAEYPRIFGEVPRAAYLHFIGVDLVEFPHVAAIFDTAGADDLVVGEILSKLRDLAESDGLHTFAAVATEMFAEFDGRSMVDVLAEHISIGEGIRRHDGDIPREEHAGDFCQQHGITVWRELHSQFGMHRRPVDDAKKLVDHMFERFWLEGEDAFLFASFPDIAASGIHFDDPDAGIEAHRGDDFDIIPLASLDLVDRRKGNGDKFSEILSHAEEFREMLPVVNLSFTWETVGIDTSPDIVLVFVISRVVFPGMEGYRSDGDDIGSRLQQQFEMPFCFAGAGGIADSGYDEFVAHGRLAFCIVKVFLPEIGIVAKIKEKYGKVKEKCRCL